MHQNSSSSETETLAKPFKPAAAAPRNNYVAVVRLNNELLPTAENTHERKIDFVFARTRHELSKKLAEPHIHAIIGVIRGRKLDFKESRKVSF